MMKKLIFFASMVALLSVGFQSCKQKSKADIDLLEAIDRAHNSQNSVEWQGVYTGVIPCADCEGINVLITLNNDNTYQMNYSYIGKEEGNEQFSGTFTWTEDGGAVVFSDKTVPYYYQVGENKLIQYDMEGKLITGEFADMYVLTKNHDEN
jgi:uncharacterized lipoprotein NlpE involved in copper resistance